MKCCGYECPNEAAGALGFNIYPMPALMAYYKTDKPLTRMNTTLPVCQHHVDTCDAHQFLGTKIIHIMKAVETGTGVTVDISNIKPVLVSFDDPEYQAMLKAKNSGDGGQEKKLQHRVTRR